MSQAASAAMPTAIASAYTRTRPDCAVESRRLVQEPAALTRVHAADHDALLPQALRRRARCAAAGR